jgi:hypothetical protein
MGLFISRPSPLSGVPSAGLTLFTHLNLSGSACNFISLHLLLFFYHYRYQHGQASYFSSCYHSGYGLSIGFFQRVSTVKVLSVTVTLQITYLRYPRREQGLVARDLPNVRFGRGTVNRILTRRGFADEEDLFVRDLEAFDDLEAREPGLGSIKSVFIYIYNKYPLNADLWSYCREQYKTRMNQVKNVKDMVNKNQVTEHFKTYASVGAKAGIDKVLNGNVQGGFSEKGKAFFSTLHSEGFSAVKTKFKEDMNKPRPASVARRDLEDDEDFLERDLDVEDLFGREYDPLDERDNGDLFVRDFDTEELFGREYDLLDERDIIDSEDLFVRDFEAEELFGREYDLLDEQYY